MPDVLVTVTLEPGAGFDNEAVVNTFAIHSEGPMDAAARLVAFDAIGDFYREIPAGSAVAVGGLISSALSRSAGSSVMKMYDITGKLQKDPVTGKLPAVGSPIDESSFALPAAGVATSLPPQCALVMTLRGRDALNQPVEGPGNERPRAQRTGRLFIGSLTTAVNDATINNTLARPTSVARNVLLNASEALQDQLEAAGMLWCVWSRADGDMFAITRTECDDSFDVLRSRKAPPTVRTAKDFTPVPALILGA